MAKYIKGKDGKFAGSIPGDPNLPSAAAATDLPTPPISSARTSQGIEWVVTCRMEDGSTIRGVQVARYGNAAITFFAKDNDINFKAASAIKKIHFDALHPGEEVNQGLSAKSATTPSPETNKCEVEGCEEEGTEMIRWSSPINRAGKVLPSGVNPKLMSVCSGHYTVLDIQMNGSN